MQITRWVLISFLTIVMFFAIWLIRDIVMLILTAIIFAVLLTSPIRFFTRLNIRRPVAVLLTVIIVIGVVALAITVVLPPLLEQISTLVSQTIPSATKQLQEELKPDVLTARYPFLQGLLQNVDLQTTFNQISSQVVERVATFSSQIFPFVGSVLSTFLSILIIIFLSLYFIADPKTHSDGMIRLFPKSYRPRANEIMVELFHAIRHYLKAQLVLMLLIGISTGIMLAILGVPLYSALGTITGLFSFVPNFGPIIALIPILAVAIINTPDKILLIVLVFYILQFVQSQIITPLLLGQGVNLPPAVILLSQIIAGIFFGFLGLLLAVPLAAIIVTLIREVYIKDILGDKGESLLAKPPPLLDTQFKPASGTD
ncbi:MAG: AI-2E family transporter [Anaerolineae bacterium]|nr:AI-2E family transporter [Anaerolineae bacterium]